MFLYWSVKIAKKNEHFKIVFTFLITKIDNPALRKFYFAPNIPFELLKSWTHILNTFPSAFCTHHQLSPISSYLN